MSNMYQVNRPGQMQPPKRRAWVRRHKFLTALCAAGLVLVAAAVIIPRVTAALSPHDYRDTGQLAQAMEAREHGVSADCAHLTASSYSCAVGFTGGAIGSYTVTVAADGSSWSAS